MHSYTPMKLMISEILEATPKEAKEATPTTTPGTVMERLSRKTPSPNGRDGLSLADDGSLSLLSKQHWFDGLWAFDTCNPNAWLVPKSTLKEARLTSLPSKRQRYLIASVRTLIRRQGTQDGKLRLGRVPSLRPMESPQVLPSVVGHMSV